MIRRFKFLFIALILLFGAIFTFASVDTKFQLRDVDEAAWIFNGYYLDLYLSGDWKSSKWREFDRYAQHPPAGNYLFGALMRAIGEPVRSVEPRRFWFEHDLNIVNLPDEFIKGLMQRITPRQLAAARYMAAAFAWLAAAAILLLAHRLSGPIAATASFLLLIFHPLYKMVAVTGTADSFMIFLLVLSMIFAVEIGRRCGDTQSRVWPFVAALAMVLGISFATKIVAIAYVPAALVAALCFARGRKNLWASIASIVLASVFACVIACFLDPGLWGSPIASTLERIAWRRERIDIQQIVFVGERLSSIAERTAFAGYEIFFSGWAGMLGLVLTCIAAVSCKKDRVMTVTVTLAAYFFFLTICTLPMAWPRYTAACLPFFVIPAGMGAGLVLGMVGNWDKIEMGQKKGWLVKLLAVSMAAVTLQFFVVSKKLYAPQSPTAEEARISRMLAFSLMRPGADPRVHQYLYLYFKASGNQKRAGYEFEQLKRTKD